MNNSGSAAATVVLPTVQILRGVAALMVAYVHIYVVSGYGHHLWPSYWPTDGLVMARGVDIFFVISGFIMLVSSRTMSPGNFIVRRLIRIAPLYWFFTFLIVVMATVTPDLFKTTVVSLEGVIKSLAFVPQFNEGRPDEIQPLLPPGWTLNYEMLFYLVFTGALFVPLRYRVALCTLVFAVLMTGRLAPGFPESAVLRFYADPILFEFVGGMILGHIYLSLWKLTRPLCVLVMFLGFCLLLTGALDTGWVHPAARAWAYGAPSCLIVLGAVLLDKLPSTAAVWKIPTALGDASYSIYLSHMFVLGAERYVWKALGLHQDTALHAAGFAVLGMLAVAVGGLICYRYLEKPLLHACQRGWRSYQTRNAPANSASDSETQRM